MKPLSTANRVFQRRNSTLPSLHANGLSLISNSNGENGEGGGSVPDINAPADRNSGSTNGEDVTSTAAKNESQEAIDGEAAAALPPATGFAGAAKRVSRTLKINLSQKAHGPPPNIIPRSSAGDDPVGDIVSSISVVLLTNPLTLNNLFTCQL